MNNTIVLIGREKPPEDRGIKNYEQTLTQLYLRLDHLHVPVQRKEASWIKNVKKQQNCDRVNVTAGQKKAGNEGSQQKSYHMKKITSYVESGRNLS